MAEPSDIEEIAGALQVSISLLKRRLRSSRPDGWITMPESSALGRLERGGPATSSALAKLEQISPQSMGATLASLEEQGLIERNPDPDDGRRVVFSISKAGRELMGNLRHARTEQLTAALQTNFSKAELKQLHAVVPLIERLAEQL